VTAAEPASDRVRVRRLPDKGRYDRETVHEILDAGFVCHLGFVDDGRPVVVPTLYGRDGELLYIHGSAASRALRASAAMPVCLTVTHVDGLVVARSLFEHSANYRCVMVFGDAELVEGDEKETGLAVLTEHVVPGRWDEARAPSAKELRATTVLRLDLAESSAKVSTGPPEDEPADMATDVWAGVIPLSVTAGQPVPDPALRPGIDVPASVRSWVPGAQRLRPGR
jgi:uncharacterized protein